MGNPSRIDVWLKLVCLFKHRTEATDACKGGHVKLNGSRVKPAATIHSGDLVEITSPAYRKLVVLECPEHTVSKEVARTLYRDETPEVRRQDDVQVAGVRERGAGRPTKKDRREQEKWRG